MSDKKGRFGQPADKIFQDTISRKSAEQGMLDKLDIIIEALQAIRDEADLTAIQSALSALDLEKVQLKG